MPVPFKHLFSFERDEVKAAFAVATCAGYGPGFKLLKAPSSAPHSKLLIITPRASGKAHDRNLIRRRARTIFYEQAAHQPPQVWILLVNKRGTATSFDQLNTFLLQHINKT